MKWPFHHGTQGPSAEAIHARQTADRELEAARAFRIQAHQVSLESQRIHKANHFGPAFESAMRVRGNHS